MKPNDHVVSEIARASTSQVSADAVMEPNGKKELDSHANMVVIGRHAYILNLSGITAQASKKEYGTEYWEYALLYIDDVLVASARGEQFLRN